MKDPFLIEAFKILDSSEKHTDDLKNIIIAYVKTQQASMAVRTDLLACLQDENKTNLSYGVALEAVTCVEVTPDVLDVLFKMLRHYNYVEDYDDYACKPHFFNCMKKALVKIAALPSVTEALLNAIKSEDTQLADAALIVFSETTLVPHNLVEILLAFPKVEKIEPTYDDYGDKNGEETVEVFNDLVIEILIKTSNISQEILEKVISYLRNPDQAIRLLMLKVLAGLNKHTDASLNALTNALNDEDDEVRDNAIEILGKTPPQTPRIVAALLAVPKQSETAYYDEDDEGVEIAVTNPRVLRAIENLANPSSEITALLITAYKSSDKQLKSSIVKALLNKIHFTEDEVNFLLNASNEYDVSIRRSISEALRKILRPKTPVIHAVMRASLEDQAKQYPYHAYFPDSSYVAYRYTALSSEGMGYINKIIQENPNALDVIIEATKDVSDQRLQEAAVEVLCHVPLNPKIIQILQLSLKDKKYSIRQKAASVLIKMTEFYLEVEAVLASDICSDNWLSAVGALRVLGKLSVLMPGGVLLFLNALDDKHQTIRDEAIEILGHFRKLPDVIIGKLIDLFDKQFKIVHIASLLLKTLSSIENPQQNVFDRALNNKDLCMAAVCAIGTNAVLLNHFQGTIIKLLKNWDRKIVLEVLSVLKHLPMLDMFILDALANAYQHHSSSDIKDSIKNTLDVLCVGKNLSVETINRLLQLVDAEPHLFSPLVAKLEPTGETMGMFINAVNSKSANLRYVALRVLSKLQDFSPEVLAIFFAALKDQEKSISTLAEEIIQMHIENMKNEKTAHKTNAKTRIASASRFIIFSRVNDQPLGTNSHTEDGERLSPRSVL